MLDGPRLAPHSGDRPTGLVVLIHGYGSNGDDLIGLAAMIQPSLPDLSFVAPDAPEELPRMANARRWWPIETFSAVERATGAAAAAPLLGAFLDAELSSTGLSPDRLLLVGFSQGTMMALQVGLRRSDALAGIVGISGMLVAPDRLEQDIRSRPPVLLIHGTEDEVVPFRSLDLAAKSLAAAGVAVETHISPGGWPFGGSGRAGGRSRFRAPRPALKGRISAGSVSCRRRCQSGSARSTQLTILAAAPVDRRKDGSLVALALAGDTGPDPWDRDTTAFRYLLATLVAFLRTVAGRHASAGRGDRVLHRIVNLVLNRAVGRPTIGHLPFQLKQLKQIW